MKRRVLLITGRPAKDKASLNGAALRAWLDRELGADYAVEMTALSRLVFRLDNDGEAEVYDPEQGFDLADFDLVVFRTVGSELELGTAAAWYLYKNEVNFTDPYLLGHGKGKLSCSFVRWARNIAVPGTIYAPARLLPAAVKRAGLAYPFILKADVAKKGRDNYLVHEPSELKQHLHEAGERDMHMLAQPYIRNDGDYRVLVVGGEASLVIRRVGTAGSHLNNTSTGATATIVDVADLPAGLAELAVRAADNEDLTVAGVDVIIDKADNTQYILEVNRAPQIATGAFADEKMAAYAAGLRRCMESARPLNREPIGRAEHIVLPGHGEKTIPAKVDSGAYSSSIWASDITESAEGLSFKLFGAGSEFYTGRELTVAKGAYTRIGVENSFGDREVRYALKMEISIRGRMQKTLFTLADRSKKIYPILLGRRLLRQGFVIDVTAGTPLLAEEKRHRRERNVALTENED